MAFQNRLLNLIVPPGAGVGDGRIVIGPDELPAELVTFYAAHSITIVTAIIYEMESGDYTYYIVTNVAKHMVGYVTGGVVTEVYCIQSGLGLSDIGVNFGQRSSVNVQFGGSPSGSFLTFTGDVDFDFTGATKTWTQYTPTVGNVGTATFTTKVGRYQWIGLKTIALGVFLDVNAAGSGASNVTITAPYNIRRTIRQTITGSSESPTSILSMIAFTSGSLNVFDRIREVSATVTGNLTGADLTAGRLINFTGIYEVADSI